MVNVLKEKDPERVRQVAVLLQNENAQLHKQLKTLADRVDVLEGQDSATLQQEIAQLKAALANRGGFAPNKSERRGRKRRPKNPPKLRTDFGPTKQPKLEIEETVFTSSEADRRCQVCNRLHLPMQGQFEESEYVDVVERIFKVVKTRRQKYARRCECKTSCPTVFSAPLPKEKETLGGRYSIRFLSLIAAQKFSDHLPLNRQANQFEHLGLDIKPNSMFGGLWSLGDFCSLTTEAIHDDVLTQGCVHIDETGWPGLDTTDTRQLWSVVSSRGAYYRILPNRSFEGARTMLKDFDGWVMSDGLTVYDKAARKFGYKQAGCWAHVRRKFVEAEKDFDEATPLLDLIDTVFLIEREIGDEIFVGKMTTEEAKVYRLTQRQARAGPLIETLFGDTNKVSVLSSLALGKAAKYMVKRKKRLTVFLEDADVPLTNNDAERALRAGVIGRKNFNGTRSRRGEVLAQMLYTLCSTAKTWGLSPAKYIEAVVRHERANQTPLLPETFLQTQISS